jgi:hypothetical protein
MSPGSSFEPPPPGNPYGSEMPPLRHMARPDRMIPGVAGPPSPAARS